MLLTIGLPVTYNSLSKIKSDIAQGNTGDNNPYSNTTEEKVPSNSLGISEEYVHDTHYDLHVSPYQLSIAYIHAHEATYVAYHSELHCPPPNNILA
ncbi:hypothetical protein GCM10027516_33150 [Niabella aquatica]